MERCTKHNGTKCPMPCPVCLIEERESLQSENEKLKELLQTLRGWLSIAAVEEGGTKEDLQSRLSKVADKIEQALNQKEAKKP